MQGIILTIWPVSVVMTLFLSIIDLIRFTVVTMMTDDDFENKHLDSVIMFHLVPENKIWGVSLC